ncbi:uncharacterized protein G2W53_044237 [Senna tora]|uniref:Uncharacterized protein n=1 Tax=Senna tora TaxID=362788 RepID=A0A834SK65_9FABA|nr:uncharacterized protein G2W53_044237 [Senna tora]
MGLHFKSTISSHEIGGLRLWRTTPQYQTVYEMYI